MLWWTLRRLKSDNPYTRERAAIKLGDVKDPRVIDPLVVALDDPKESVRRRVAEALGKIGDVRAIKPLVAALKDFNMLVREEAAKALIKIGDAAVEPLLIMLKDRDWIVKEHAALALQSLRAEPKDDDQRALLAVMVGDWEKAVCLGSVAVDPLVALLGVGKESVRWQAARSLGMIGNARAVEPLIMAALEDRELSVREAARQAQLNIGSATVEPFVALLGHKVWKVRQEAAERLSWLKWTPQNEEQHAAYAVARLDWDEAIKIGVAAAEPLALALTAGEKQIHESAAITLGMIGDTRAVKPLIAALKSAQNPGEARIDRVKRRSHAASPKGHDSLIKIVEVLGQIKSEEAVAPLIQVYMNASDTLERSAMLALEEIGSVQVTRLLLSELRSISMPRKIKAAELLAKLKHPQAVERLTEKLKDVTFERQEANGRIWGDPNYAVAIAAAKALSEVGDPRAIVPLVTVYDTEKYDLSSRHYLEVVIEALEKLLEAEATSLPSQDLLMITALHDKSYEWTANYNPRCGDDGPNSGVVTVSCSQVRQLARQELIRRGLEA